MKLGIDGFWNAENDSEIREMCVLNAKISFNVSESYRRAIGVEHESSAALAWDSLVSHYMQQVEVSRADAKHCVATNLASLVTKHYPLDISQRVMTLYPLCRTTSFGRLIPMPAEKTNASFEPDRAQLEKIMDCEDKDWKYFARTDPTPKARDFISSGDGGLYWPQVCLGGYIDSISVVDCLTGEEMLKQPSDADVSSWAVPSTPHVVELQPDDKEPLSLDDAEKMIANVGSVDLTLGTRAERVGVYVDNWIPLDTRGDLRRLIAALVREVPK